MSVHIAVVSAGAMGAAVAARFANAGCIVLTNLDGRSDATRQRASATGMQDVPMEILALRADYVLSILPPRDAFAFAERFVAARMAQSSADGRQVVFADCNAVNPETVKRISQLFYGTSIEFIDAGIIGGPPSDDYNPTMYASAAKENQHILDKFVDLSKYGLKVEALRGDNVTIGDASALKMSYAGITKGLTGIFSTMILAAHASSPATSQALLSELQASQPALLQRITRSVPGMLPKAYRWVGEMEEIADFVGGKEAKIYEGMANLYRRVEESVAKREGDVEVLSAFVVNAKKVIEENSK